MTMTTKSRTTRAVSPRAAGKRPAPKAQRRRKPRAKGAKAPAAVAPPTKRPTRASQILSLATRPEGVTMDELVKAFKVQKHTLRAVLSVESRKAGVRIGLVDGRYRAVEE